MSVVVGFAAEAAQAVFDGDDFAVHLHIDFHGFHLGSMVFEQAQFGAYSLGGIHHEHVNLEVGEVARGAVGITENDLVNGSTIFVAELDFSGRAAVYVGLWFGLEV